MRAHPASPADPAGRNGRGATRGAALAGAALLLLLAGCSASGSSDVALAPYAVEDQSGEYAAAESSGAGSGLSAAQSEATADGEADAAVTDTAEREIVATGSATVTAEDPLEAADGAAELATAAGGHVADRYETTATEYQAASATITLRIPSARLDAFIAQLDGLGSVDEERLSRQDVTAEGQDLDARITALRTSTDRLLALLERAESTDDLVMIESSLSQRQSELESLEGQRRVLDDQVALSTFELLLRGPDEAPVPEPENFLTGLSAGWNALVAAGSGLLVALGVLLPWIVLLAVLALAAMPLVRRLRARRAASGDTAAPAATPVLRGPFGDDAVE